MRTIKRSFESGSAAVSAGLAMVEGVVAQDLTHHLLIFCTKTFGPGLEEIKAPLVDQQSDFLLFERARDFLRRRQKIRNDTKFANRHILIDGSALFHKVSFLFSS